MRAGRAFPPAPAWAQQGSAEQSEDEGAKLGADEARRGEIDGQEESIDGGSGGDGCEPGKAEVARRSDSDPELVSFLLCCDGGDDP